MDLQDILSGQKSNERFKSSDSLEGKEYHRQLLIIAALIYLGLNINSTESGG
jgi:hypothetical protein